METAADRLCLGTAQLGLDYGVTNAAGKPDDAAAEALLDLALRRGVRRFDTAAAYGDAEARLGGLLATLKDRHAGAVTIVTKALGRDASGRIDPDALLRSAERSLTALRVPRLSGLLLHHAADLSDDDGPALAAALRRLRDDGVTEAIGLSGTVPEVAAALDRLPDCDIVQVPTSALDQRLARCGLLDRLRDAGIAVYCRSAFLQGIILAPKPPAYFADLAPALARLDAISADRLSAALAYPLSLPGVRPVVGAATARELGEILDAAERADSLAGADFSACSVTEEHLIDPFRWPPRDQMR